MKKLMKSIKFIKNQVKAYNFYLLIPCSIINVIASFRTEIWNTDKTLWTGTALVRTKRKVGVFIYWNTHKLNSDRAQRIDEERHGGDAREWTRGAAVTVFDCGWAETTEWWRRLRSSMLRRFLHLFLFPSRPHPPLKTSSVDASLRRLHSSLASD